ncbi:unnamed protein product [Arctia plantaginis]|uniref:Uncharacterized protein n=1 Tax=Arctia plantaginis TaxID=874455 RepID=A0A8S1BMQ2_ARCPL|nr:unnamed protein product [Arctia plantaginis]
MFVVALRRESSGRAAACGAGGKRRTGAVGANSGSARPPSTRYGQSSPERSFAHCILSARRDRSIRDLTQRHHPPRANLPYRIIRDLFQQCCL